VVQRDGAVRRLDVLPEGPPIEPLAVDDGTAQGVDGLFVRVRQQFGELRHIPALDLDVQVTGVRPLEGLLPAAEVGVVPDVRRGVHDADVVVTLRAVEPPGVAPAGDCEHEPELRPVLLGILPFEGVEVRVDRRSNLVADCCHGVTPKGPSYSGRTLLRWATTRSGRLTVSVPCDRSTWCRPSYVSDRSLILPDRSHCERTR